MEPYMVDQEKFYGPLDLLLYLVEKDELDVTEISIASLADQFVRYLETLEWSLEWDEITSFLVMAALLLRLKARSLLPVHFKTPDETEAEEETDSRAQLIERILRYKRFKMAAQALAALEMNSSLEPRYFRPLTEKPEAGFSYRPSQLYEAMLRVKQHKAIVYQFTLPFEEVNIEQKMEQILHYLELRSGRNSFAEMISFLTPNPNEIAGMFLGLLELTREQKLRLDQAGYLEDIIISSRKG